MHWARFGAHSTLVERRRGAACAEGASGGTWRHAVPRLPCRYEQLLTSQKKNTWRHAVPRPPCRYERLLTSRAGEQLERLGARRLAQVRSTIDSFG